MRHQLLSTDRCRKAIGPTCDLGDSELEQVRDQLYALAEIVVDQLFQRSFPSSPPAPQSVLDRQNDRNDLN